MATQMQLEVILAGNRIAIDLRKLPPWGRLARNSCIVRVYVTSKSREKFQLHSSVKYLNSSSDKNAKHLLKY